jgi:hypothetical protein
VRDQRYSSTLERQTSAELAQRLCEMLAEALELSSEVSSMMNVALEVEATGAEGWINSVNSRHIVRVEGNK